MSGIYIAGMDEKEYRDLCIWARYGANNLMIGEQPCIQLSPHGRLIDADALVRSCKDEKGSYYGRDAAIIGEAVENATTIIPAAAVKINPDCKICKYKDAGPFSESCLDCGDELKNFMKCMSDNVNHPEHYTTGGIECIDAIRASLGNADFSSYCKGNVIKYIWRYRHKGGVEDLEKARVYLNWMIEAEGEEDNV